MWEEVATGELGMSNEEAIADAGSAGRDGPSDWRTRGGGKAIGGAARAGPSWSTGCPIVSSAI